MSEILRVYTARGLGTLLEDGGTSAWKLNPERAGEVAYVVCVQNRRHKSGDWGKATAQHQEAFVIAKVKAVVPAPGEPKRHLVVFSSYAQISDMGLWDGCHNPVRYLDCSSTLAQMRVDPESLTWLPMPTEQRAAA